MQLLVKKARVISSFCAFITLIEPFFEIIFGTFLRFAGLNRKQKASCELEANKAKSNKICLQRSVAKTLLTLSRHSEKSEEAAITLLYVSSEHEVTTCIFPHFFCYGEPD